MSFQSIKSNIETSNKYHTTLELHFQRNHFLFQTQNPVKCQNHRMNTNITTTYGIYITALQSNKYLYELNMVEITFESIQTFLFCKNRMQNCSAPYSNWRSIKVKEKITALRRQATRRVCSYERVKNPLISDKESMSNFFHSISFTIWNHQSKTSYFIQNSEQNSDDGSFLPISCSSSCNSLLCLYRMEFNFCIYETTEHIKLYGSDFYYKALRFFFRSSSFLVLVKDQLLF